MSSRSNIKNRTIWSDADFEEMGWHDVRIHAYAVLPQSYELAFDIDYIVRWVRPVSQGDTFRFYLAPATLTFKNVSDVRIELISPQGLFSIQKLTREDERLTPNGKMKSWLWTLVGNEGNICFRATGYEQYLRKKPALWKSQVFTISERGGISFDHLLGKQ